MAKRSKAVVALVLALAAGIAYKHALKSNTDPMPILLPESHGRAPLSATSPLTREPIAVAVNLDSSATAKRPEQTGTSSAPAPTPGPKKKGPQAPSPMSEASRQRVATASKQLAEQDPALGDLVDLAAHEQPDPSWSPRIETALGASLYQHTAQAAGGLELGGIRCTATVCQLSAIGGQATDDPNADWQRIVGEVMSEPWFAQQFDDVSTSVTHDGTGVVYLTHLVRKPAE